MHLSGKNEHQHLTEMVLSLISNASEETGGTLPNNIIKYQSASLSVM